MCSFFVSKVSLFCLAFSHAAVYIQVATSPLNTNNFSSRKATRDAGEFLILLAQILTSYKKKLS